MNLNFLNVHHLRMKKIGAYALLYRNSIQKGTWKKFGFEEGYEQDNMIFALLLFIMEESLKEEICTIDDIGQFIDEVNSIYFKKSLSYDDCKEMADFMVNTILCNEGIPMYFKTINFKSGGYEDINISFVRNKIEYVDGVKRVSYSLTDDAYSLLLSTLEVEENMKITINEMIFKLHLEKADYDKAVDDIKNIFSLFRARVQRMEEAIRKIKENPLSYSTEDYHNIMEGNLELIKQSKLKYKLHREQVNERIKEFEEKNIHIQELNLEEKDNLNNLRIIENYLSRTIDEDQRVLKKHFDLKSVYGKELENITKMSLIERFNFKNEVFDKVTEDISKLENIHLFLKPLFKKKPDKKYNINKALEFQKTIKKYETEEEVISFNEADLIQEDIKRKIEKLNKYKSVIEMLLELSYDEGKISLSEIFKLIGGSEVLRNTLVPNVRIFREVIIEMLKNGIINIRDIIEERKDNVENEEVDFHLNRCILELIENKSELKDIKEFRIIKIMNKDDIKLEGVVDEDGLIKNFICSDILFQIVKEQG